MLVIASMNISAFKIITRFRRAHISTLLFADIRSIEIYSEFANLPQEESIEILSWTKVSSLIKKSVNITYSLTISKIS